MVPAAVVRAGDEGVLDVRPVRAVVGDRVGPGAAAGLVHRVPNALVPKHGVRVIQSPGFEIPATPGAGYHNGCNATVLGARSACHGVV